MGKIRLKNMRFHGYHGVLEEEKKMGQEFDVDVELDIDFTKVAKTDNVGDTVDYSKVFYLVKDIVENKRFNLLEAMASHILDDIKKIYNDKVKEIVVTIRKPSAPIKGIFDYAEVEAKWSFEVNS